MVKLSLTDTISNCVSSYLLYFGWKIVWKRKCSFLVQRKKWLNLHFLNPIIVSPFELLNRHFPHFDKYQIPLPLPIFPSRNNIPANANSNRNCIRYLIKHALTFLPYVHMLSLSLSLFRETRNRKQIPQFVPILVEPRSTQELTRPVP